MEIINLNKAVNDRFQTLINNIKNASNSYYDSFLDLLEETIKYILNENNIVYDATKTCGAILKEKDVSCFLLETLALDEYTFSKLPDYIKKCNDHKHKKEKTLSLESVTNYLKVYFRLINYYFRYKEIGEVEYDENYFINIFNETEKLNNQYKEEVNKLKNELEDAYNKKQLTEDAYLECKSLLTNSEIEKYSLEEQNKVLEIQIKTLNAIKNSVVFKLDEISKQNEFIISLMQNQKNNDNINNNERIINSINNSKKEYIWDGNEDTLKSYKTKVMYLSIFTFVLGIVLTILNTLHNGYYTTYSFFENIWMIFIIVILIKNYKMKQLMEDSNFLKYTTFKTISNKYNLKEAVYEKFSYKIFRGLAYFSAGATMFLSLVSEDKSILIFILEFVFIISLIYGTKTKNRIQDGYCLFLKLTNENSILVYVIPEKKFYTYEEFSEKFKGKMN